MKGTILLLLAGLSSAAVYEGVVNDASTEFHFMGHFVFDVIASPGIAGSIKGEFEIENWVAADAAKSQEFELWLFDDEDDSWPAVYKKDVTCAEARSKAKNFDPTINGIKPNFKLKFDATGKANKMVNITQHMRDRWWYAVIGHCNTPAESKGIQNFKYYVHFENINRSFWNIEFGSNQAGLQTLYMCFFLVYLPFAAVHFFGSFQLSRKLVYMHPMVRIFAAVVLMQFVSVLVKLIHWGAFITNGVGINGTLVVGDICDCISRTAFILILMLMAQGWTISGEELTNKKLIIIVVLTFFIGEILILMWEFLVADPAAVTPDLAVTIFLYIILLIWVLLAVWFVHTVIRSYKKEDNPVKKALFRNLGIIYTPWFFGLPVVTMLTLQVAPTMADIIVQSVSLLITTIGYMVLSFLLWPSRAEEYFSISTPDVMKAQFDTYEQL